MQPRAAIATPEPARRRRRFGLMDALVFVGALCAAAAPFAPQAAALLAAPEPVHAAVVVERGFVPGLRDPMALMDLALAPEAVEEDAPAQSDAPEAPRAEARPSRAPTPRLRPSLAAADPVAPPSPVPAPVVVAAASPQEPSEAGILDAPVKIIAAAAESAPAPAALSAPVAAPAPVPASAPSIDPNAPRIRLIIGALGVHEGATRLAMDITPPEVALSFAPVGAGATRLAAEAAARGRLLLVEAPMEPVNYPRINPGPLTLLVESSAQENLDRLAKVIETAPQAFGVATYLGARYAADPEEAETVVKALRGRGLALIEVQPAARSLFAATAKRLGARYRAAPLRIDENREPGMIAKALRDAESRARRDGEAIIVGAAYQETLEALRDWLPTLTAKGIRLAPLDEG